MSRFPESITLTTEEVITLIAGVEVVIEEMTERGDPAIVFELQHAIAPVLEKFTGGSNLPSIEE